MKQSWNREKEVKIIRRCRAGVGRLRMGTLSGWSPTDPTEDGPQKHRACQSASTRKGGADNESAPGLVQHAPSTFACQVRSTTAGIKIRGWALDAPGRWMIPKSFQTQPCRGAYLTVGADAWIGARESHSRSTRRSAISSFRPLVVDASFTTQPPAGLRPSDGSRSRRPDHRRAGVIDYASTTPGRATQLPNVVARPV